MTDLVFPEKRICIDLAQCGVGSNKDSFHRRPLKVDCTEGETGKAGQVPRNEVQCTAHAGGQQTSSC